VNRAHNLILGGLLMAVLWLCTAMAGVQRELASRQTHGTFIIARESGHNILFDQPDVIVAAGRKLLGGGAGKQR